METMQPWNQMGQGYSPGQGYFNPRPFNMAQPTGQAPFMTGKGKDGGSQTEAQPPTQQGISQHGTMQPQNTVMPDTTMQMEWLSGLSREEKLEAKRLALQANFSFEGYQVVRREFISHQFDPAMTIRGTSITFKNSCISKLENATYIHFLITPTEMRLLIRSVSEGARDAIRWCIIKGDKRKSRQISCRPFTEKLYEMMGWDPLYRYKMQGMKINYAGEDMYLFDLQAVECFIPQHRDPATGKIPRPKAVLPEEWNDGFGMSVEEHEDSTKVDLDSGFTEAMAEEDGGTAAPDAQPDMDPDNNPALAEDHKTDEAQTAAADMEVKR